MLRTWWPPLSRSQAPVWETMVNQLSCKMGISVSLLSYSPYNYVYWSAVWHFAIDRVQSWHNRMWILFSGRLVASLKASLCPQHISQLSCDYCRVLLLTRGVNFLLAQTCIRIQSNATSLWILNNREFRQSNCEGWHLTSQFVYALTV
jgi:hypothetical protein